MARPESGVESASSGASEDDEEMSMVPPLHLTTIRRRRTRRGDQAAAFCIAVDDRSGERKTFGAIDENTLSAATVVDSE
ncbi:hypothetical protein Emed_007653 [Eimeria media]